MMTLVLTACLVPDAVAIEGLADTRFRVREASAKWLASGDPRSRWPQLKAVAQSHPDPEGRRRAAELAAKCRSQYHAKVFSELGTLPYLDACWYSIERGYAPFYDGADDGGLTAERDRLKHYLVKAGACCQEQPDAYRSYRYATRLYLEDCLDSGDDPSDWGEWLAEMRRRDDYWHKSCGTINPARR